MVDAVDSKSTTSDGVRVQVPWLVPIIITSQIIIITDGYDMFPPEEEAMGIPVLCLINNNDESVKPPFGKVARIKV